MAESKHTPGPWVIDPKYVSEVQTADLQTVASCWHEHCEGREITLVGVLPCPLEESAANARLIAAAPDLLEAARAAKKYLEPDLVEPGRTVFWQLVAAIRKAEGR